MRGRRRSRRAPTHVGYHWRVVMNVTPGLTGITGFAFRMLPSVAPLLILQRLHAAARFSNVSEPPRASGTMWSMVNALGSRCVAL